MWNAKQSCSGIELGVAESISYDDNHYIMDAFLTFNNSQDNDGRQEREKKKKKKRERKKKKRDILRKISLL